MILNVVIVLSARRGQHCPGFSHNDRCYRFFGGPRRADDAEVRTDVLRVPNGFFFRDVHVITALLLDSSVGVLSKTFSWGPLGFHHKPARPQRCAAPGPALQRGPDARLGGRQEIFDGVFVSSAPHWPLRRLSRVFAVVVSDSSIFQSGRFIWLDGSSWIYADWQPGRPGATSAVDSCVEVLGRTEATLLLHYFCDVSLWLM